MSAGRNEVTITLIFSDADFGELEFVARVLGRTTDEVMAEILSPDKMAQHVREVLATLRREHEKLRRRHPEVVGAMEVVQRVRRKHGLP